jgi:hypothetical protein
VDVELQPVDRAVRGGCDLDWVSAFENAAPIKAGKRVNGDRGYGLISIVADMGDFDGTPTRRSFVYRADGRDYAIGSGAFVNVIAVDPFTADFVIKPQNVVVSTGRQTLALDGQRLVVSSRGTDIEGQRTQSLLVWSREHASDVQLNSLTARPD